MQKDSMSNVNKLVIGASWKLLESPKAIPQEPISKRNPRQKKAQTSLGGDTFLRPRFVVHVIASVLSLVRRLQRISCHANVIGQLLFAQRFLTTRKYSSLALCQQAQILALASSFSVTSLKVLPLFQKSAHQRFVTWRPNARRLG